MRVVDPGLVAAALSAGPDPLTQRERDVLSAAVDGATVADIAAKVRMEAVRAGRQNGWL